MVAKKLEDVLDEPIELGPIFRGSIETGGAMGEVDIAISISGPKNSGILYIVATKVITAELWEFSLLDIVVDDQREQINLFEGAIDGAESEQAVLI